MSNFSLYLSGAIADWLKAVDMPSAPSQIYIDLFDNTPVTPNSILLSISGSANRPALSLGTKTQLPNGYQLDNDTVVTFTNSSNNPVTLGGVGVYDAVTGGNQLYFQVIADQNILALDKVELLVADLSIIID